MAYVESNGHVTCIERNISKIAGDAVSNNC